jgi:hypothetical protein
VSSGGFYALRDESKWGYFDHMDLRRRALAVGLALCVLVGCSTSAAADAGSHVLRKSSYPTSVSLSSEFPAFSGRISSRFGPCEKQRRVALFQKISGGETKRLGKDTSDSSGRWAIQLDNVKSGAYYAKVKPKRKSDGGSPLTCKKGRSETVIVN